MGKDINQRAIERLEAYKDMGFDFIIKDISEGRLKVGYYSDLVKVKSSTKGEIFNEKT